MCPQALLVSMYPSPHPGERVVALLRDKSLQPPPLIFLLHFWTFSLHFRHSTSPDPPPPTYMTLLSMGHFGLSFVSATDTWCLNSQIYLSFRQYFDVSVPLILFFPPPSPVLCCMFVCSSNPSVLIVIAFIQFWELIGGPWAISYSARLSFSSASYINLHLALSFPQRYKRDSSSQRIFIYFYK